MLYLIKTVYYIEETGEVLKLLKIGYTRDNEVAMNSRFVAYKLHNPLSKVLYKIPGGSEDHEKRIQYKFKDLLYPDYGREWFYYSEEIIKFFEEFPNFDEIEKYPRSFGGSNFRARRKQIKEILENVCTIDCEKYNYDFDNKINNIIQDYYNELENNLSYDIFNDDKVLDYLKKKFGEDNVNSYLQKLKIIELGKYSEDDNVNEEIRKFLELYELCPTMYDKLKLLCETDISEKSISLILDIYFSRNSEIKNYYNSLGPERLRSLSYNKTQITRELGIIMFNPLVLQHYIYLDFKVGDRLSLVEIKTKLMTIYEEINYKKTPKATDILEYFNIKDISIYEKNLDGSRKRIRGYELLSKKG